jgi:XRE family transcriptional regulator, fatty acid utilization regulator
MQKTFIGPHLRRLRLERGETQGAMAKALGISPSYVNLLENNERSVSVQVLLRLFEAYGVDWREIMPRRTGRASWPTCAPPLQDPIFEGAPTCRSCARRWSMPRTLQVPSCGCIGLAGGEPTSSWPATKATVVLTGKDHGSPEAAVHNVFRRNRNHFRELEEAAERFWAGRPNATRSMPR